MTAVQKAQKQMTELRNKKAAQLQTIEEMRQDAAQKAQEAQDALERATAEMNLEKYEQAQNDLRKALTSEQMYKARADQLQRQEIISEDESDAVINSLLSYEDALADKLAADIAPHLDALETILTAYQADVKETENTISEWCSTVHAYYRSETTTYTGPDGERTNRAPYALAVHPNGYAGSEASRFLDQFIHGPIAQLLNR